MTHAAIDRSSLAGKFLELLRNDTSSIHHQSDHCCSISYYADILNVRPDYLDFVIQEETGKTARELIGFHLINYSKLLLRHTDLTIIEIARRLFFFDIVRFFWLFEEHTAVSPISYRSTSCVP